jgi:hypothetical protein
VSATSGTPRGQVVGTKLLAASVLWLSSEQRHFDGHLIWTYDFPQNQLEAIGIDPRTVTVARRIPTGPWAKPDAQSRHANGSNLLNVIDLAQGKVVQQIKTGQFP